MKKQNLAKLKWFSEAKFGLFIHWGLYAIPAGIWKGKEVPGIGEWIMKRAQIPVETYEKLADDFNPVKFKANECARLASEAGMKYLAITAKHHDGFAMYHSKVSKYNIVDATPYGRDPMKDLQTACEKYNLKLCFYYSQVQDWHEQNGVGNDWDFDVEGYGDKDEPGKRNFKAYVEGKVLPQLTELLTNYGEIGMIWFDTPMDCPKKYSTQILKHVASLQPNCLISGRIGNGVGDFVEMPDNGIPARVKPYVWETPGTLNETWGYKKNDERWKTPQEVLRWLVRIVSRGGNYLLNIGPMADGTIPKASMDVLLQAGKWMKKNGESIYNALPSPEFDIDYDWGYATTKPHKLYLHLFGRPDHGLKIYELASKPLKVSLLASDKPLTFRYMKPEKKVSGRLLIDLPEKLTYDIDTVVVVEVEDEVPRVGEYNK
jgi:alpha-L-fucosidase